MCSFVHCVMSFAQPSVQSFQDCLTEFCTTICVKLCELFDGDLYGCLCEVV